MQFSDAERKGYAVGTSATSISDARQALRPRRMRAQDLRHRARSQLPARSRSVWLARCLSKENTPPSMQIVVTHEMADFDALASAVGAQKLHGDAPIVIGRHLGSRTRAFLSLHRDRLNTISLDDLDFANVTHLILVDVRRASRLEDIEPLLARIRSADPSLRVTVYDHHEHASDDLPANEAVVERVGAATTLLVEHIRARGLALDAVEATLFALGIHEDTGCLTFAATTARDAEAFAWLLHSGANLSMLSRFLRVRFDAEQKSVLERLLSATRTERFGAVEVAIALVDLERQVHDLGEIVSRAAELDGAAAYFALFEIAQRRVQLVARSSTPLVNAGKVLEQLGGGGHAAAASGIVRHGDGKRVLVELVAALQRGTARMAEVSELMSNPAHTVDPSLSMAELGDRLAHWKCSGAPVVGDGALVGVVSLRDVERARWEGRLAAPVARYMTRQPLVAHPDESLESALERMTDADIGRLPVLDGGKLVGIVTRSDLIRTLYRRKS